MRRAGEAESWLASGAITIDRKAENWLRKDLADVAATRIASVDITRPDGKNVRIAKTAEGDANFKLADIAKGREAGSDYAINGPASTLGGLKFDDAVPAKDAPPAEKPLKARFATFDGLIVDVTAWEKDGKDYAQFSASEDEKAASAHADAELTKAKADDATKPADAKTETPAADPAKDREDEARRAQEGSRRSQRALQGLDVRTAAVQVRGINKAPDDLLKPLEDKKGDASKKSDAKSPGAKADAAKKPKAG